MDDILKKLAQAEALLESDPQHGSAAIDEIYNNLENFEQIPPQENSSLQNKKIPSATVTPESVYPTTNTINPNQITQNITQDIIQKFESLGVGELIGLMGEGFLDNLLSQISSNVIARLDSEGNVNE